MKKIVILTGAGISAESGIKTFRDGDGLWKTHRFEDLATPGAWEKDPALVLEFYNARRRQMLEVRPNEAHFALAMLAEKFNVEIVTQNVDDLHERAGSGKILHLHGELRKARSTVDPGLVYEIDGWELKIGDKCEKGSQLRPHIVWFGEPVDELNHAIEMVKTADLMMIIGTSLVVYPAAGLIRYTRQSIPKYIIDPGAPRYSPEKNLTFINEKASKAVPELVKQLLTNGF
ncbi:MAG: NAD-dependent deacylase [Bacteroidales bacterium]|nr:NAD-dependent deacylase [Bacteroidales bacterium]